MKSMSYVVVFLAVSGCAAPNLTGITAPITALLTAASDTAALDQELAEEFTKESARLYFLSNRQETCLDNDGLTPTFTKTKEIERRELALLRLRLADLYSLADYADSLAKMDKARTARARQVVSALQIVRSGSDIAGHMPAFAIEAEAVRSSATAVAALVKLVDSYATAEAIRSKAREMYPKVDAMIVRLKDRFNVVGDRAQLYVNAWRACTREKYIYIRDRMAGPAKPVSIVELDNSYGEFRTRYHNYLKRIPHIEKEAFDKIRVANRAMLQANTIEDFAAAAEQLAALVDQLVSTYKTTKESVRIVFGP